MVSNSSSDDPVAHALDLYDTASDLGPALVRKSHTNQWEKWWQSGVEIEGNRTVAASANSSLYYLMTSMHPLEPWSVSPCGPGSNCYHQHRFWDSLTWDQGALVLLRPDLVRHSMIAYRLARLEAAKARAVDYGFEGADWPWESALTGLDTV